jgi:hypothetical protein
MNLILSHDKYNINHIYYSDSIKNTVIENSDFAKVLFSNDDLYLNGVYLLINFHDVSMETYYNKYKCIINTEKNINMFKFLYKLEHDILHKYNTHKNKKLIIHNQLKQGNIKLFIEDSNVSKKYNSVQFLLKISGIWDKGNEIGLTYKFIML